MATNFPNLVGTGGAEVVEMLFGEGWDGLEGVMLTCEVSSISMLMVLGGVWMVIGVVSRVGVAWMMG